MQPSQAMVQPTNASPEQEVALNLVKNLPENQGIQIGERRRPQVYSAIQRETLEAAFQVDMQLSDSKRLELSKALGLTEKQIKTWYQNRRNKRKNELPN